MTDILGVGSAITTVRLKSPTTASSAFLERMPAANVYTVSADVPAGNTTPEEVAFTFDADATDVDVPAQTLTFSLVDAPAGAAINGTTGVFTWTPTEAQGPGDYTFRVRVSDGTATDEGWVTLRVTEVNKPPVLTGVPAAATIPEMVAYTFDANATDSDLPAQTLTFSLVGAPTGAAIDPASGVFTWTPSEAQGPGTYPFTVRVNDGVANTDQAITLTVVELDFGDAPDGYKTLLASDGARHVIVSGIHLGAAIDTEPDGQPSADALADDNTGTPDDEDGLTATTLIVGAPVTVTVTVVGHGFLSAWMDWNGDGDWLDQDEQIADDQELVTGTYPFPLTVPAFAVPTAGTFARIRYSSQTDLSYDGAAADGEVEDYQFPILAPPTVTLSVDKANIVENAGVATFTATLSYATSQDVTVDLGFRARRR